MMHKQYEIYLKIYFFFVKLTSALYFNLFHPEQPSLPLQLAKIIILTLMINLITINLQGSFFLPNKRNNPNNTLMGNYSHNVTHNKINEIRLIDNIQQN